MESRTAGKLAIHTEDRYNKICEVLCRAFNPVRITDIRKSIEFVPMTYDLYKKESLNFINMNEEELDLDLGKPIFLTAEFGWRFFPKFDTEFDQIMYYPKTRTGFNSPKFTNAMGMLCMPKENYRSLLIASHNLSEDLGSKYFNNDACLALGKNVEILVDFYISQDDIPANRPMMAQITVLNY